MRRGCFISFLWPLKIFFQNQNIKFFDVSKLKKFCFANFETFYGNEIKHFILNKASMKWF